MFGEAASPSGNLTYFTLVLDCRVKHLPQFNLLRVFPCPSSCKSHPNFSLWALCACVVTVGSARHVLTLLSISISWGDWSLWSLHRRCCESRGINVWPILEIFLGIISEPPAYHLRGRFFVSLWCLSNWSINLVLYRTKRVVATFIVLKLHIPVTQFEGNTLVA